MKFAFLIMGAGFQPETDSACIHGGTAQMIGVSSVDEACMIAERLMNEGISCIELCGAFGPDGAKRVIEATKNSLPVGYVTHFESQNSIFKAVFGE